LSVACFCEKFKQAVIFAQRVSNSLRPRQINERRLSQKSILCDPASEMTFALPFARLFTIFIALQTPGLGESLSSLFTPKKRIEYAFS